MWLTTAIKGEISTTPCSCADGKEVSNSSLCYACKANANTECLLFLYNTGAIDYNPTPSEGGECRPTAECSGEFMIEGGIEYCLIDNDCLGNKCDECVDGSKEVCKEGKCLGGRIILMPTRTFHEERKGYCTLSTYCTGYYILSSDSKCCYDKRVLTEGGCKGQSCTRCNETTKDQCTKCLEPGMYINENDDCTAECSQYYWTVEGTKYCGSKCKDGFANVAGSMECTSCGEDCAQNCLRLSPYNDCYETCEEGKIPFKPSQAGKITCIAKTECLSFGNYLNADKAYCTYGTPQ
eukprot:TRINITY_DN16100_c0_g1_i2.p1 TRINITY_DN16100_c0_g1~~TRINITY_DN16100_c0_g1_i2.p1  ORF type:complete len:308 (-),score=53.60 TRINITY_DN16100_c0_g1_i2:406-1287(-)